jgi:hypothetical protein
MEKSQSFLALVRYEKCVLCHLCLKVPKQEEPKRLWSPMSESAETGRAKTTMVTYA